MQKSIAISFCRPCRKRQRSCCTGIYDRVDICVCEHQLLFSIPTVSMFSQKHPPYHGIVNSETPGDSQNAFLHWGDVLGLLSPAGCQLAKATALRTASHPGNGVYSKKSSAELLFLCSKHRKTKFLQEAAIAAVSGEDAAEPQEEQGMPSGFGSTSSLPGSHSNGGEDSEVARFGAAKEKKHSLENGISVFNRCSHACVP